MPLLAPVTRTAFEIFCPVDCALATVGVVSKAHKVTTSNRIAHPSSIAIAVRINDKPGVVVVGAVVRAQAGAAIVAAAGGQRRSVERVDAWTIRGPQSTGVSLNWGAQA